MVVTHDKIDQYMIRLRDLAGTAGHIQRFYLFQGDEQLYDLEYELSNSELASDFYARLADQYRSWRAQMGETQWQEVLDHNETLNGASRNWLLDELDSEA